MESAVCETCGSMGLHKGADGCFYCRTCGTQSQNFLDEDLADFQKFGKDELGNRLMAITREHNVRRKEQEARMKKFNDMLKSGGGAAEEDEGDDEIAVAKAREEELLKILSQKPDRDEDLDRIRTTLTSRFSAVENVHVWSGTQAMYDPSELTNKLATHIRDVYVKGMQKIVQMQSEALVEVFGVSPCVCGIVGPLWLRFVGSTRVFQKEWANDAIFLADADYFKKQEENEPTKPPHELPSEEAAADEEADADKEAHAGKVKKKRAKKQQKIDPDKVPRSKSKQRISTILVEALKNRIPLRATLGIVFLACHIAREPVLPSDITAWAAKGSLPYVTVFLKFQTQRFFGPELKVIPLPEMEPKQIFRSPYVSNARTVEMMAAYIAIRLKLELPPVNFFPISERLLEAVGLGSEGLMQYLERLYQWYSPDGLWISSRRKGFPSRAYVAAMVIVTLKILYNIDGHAESSLYWPSVGKRLRAAAAASSRAQRAKFQSLLETIEKRLLDDELKQEIHLKDYLQYCQEVVYPGLKFSQDEETVHDHLWQCFEKQVQKDPDDEPAKKDDEEHEIQADKSRTNNVEKSESEYSLGSAAWSKAASLQKQEVRSNEPESERAAGRDDQTELPTPTTQEVSSAKDEEQFRIQQAKSLVLREIAREIELGGFKLFTGSLRKSPSAAAAAEDEEEDIYPLVPTNLVKRKQQKHVHGDYFILLFACSRAVSVRANIVNKCVQKIEGALWNMERKCREFVDREEGEHSEHSVG